MLTVRGTILLLFAAPFLAAATWAPALLYVGIIYFVFVLGLLVADYRLAGRVDRFEVRREHDTKLSLGADNPIHLHLYNRGRRPVRFSMRDEPPAAYIVDERILKGQAAPRGQWHAVYHVRPLRRGDYRFGDINLRWQAPLGLVVRQGCVAAANPVKVYPNLLNVRRYEILLRRNRLQELGLRHTRVMGQGTEFERLREYLPDDEYRRIDWKATARRHRPVTIEYQSERSQNIMIVLDIGRMMQSPVAQIAKLDYVINAALLFTYVASGKGDKVGMMTFADDVQQFLRPRQGRSQFYRMLELLYSVEAQAVEPDYRRALAYLAVKQRKRSLIVLFTDLSGGMGMQTLVTHISVLARNSLPLVVTISDPDIHRAAHQSPHDSLSVYRRAAAAQLLDARKVILEDLQRQGVLTLDVPADHLSIAVINRYLELKARTRL
ncbi:MAG: DUF58 domain-containing protein [Chloroflexota bacterium]|jgi:uncharacterized protein (DUF58 family)